MCLISSLLNFAQDTTATAQLFWLPDNNLDFCESSALFLCVPNLLIRLCILAVLSVRCPSTTGQLFDPSLWSAICWMDLRKFLNATREEYKMVCLTFFILLVLFPLFIVDVVGGGVVPLESAPYKGMRVHQLQPFIVFSFLYALQFCSRLYAHLHLMHKGVCCCHRTQQRPPNVLKKTTTTTSDTAGEDFSSLLYKFQQYKMSDYILPLLTRATQQTDSWAT